MSTPESLLDTQALLLDDGVDDTQLANVLMRVHAEELTWLSTVLLSTSDPPLPDPRQTAQLIVIETLAQVVAHRDRLWQHKSLRAWLVSLVLHQCEQRANRLRFRLRMRGILAPWIHLSVLLRRLSKTEVSAPPLSPLQEIWSKMTHNEQICLLLHAALKLSQAEIAAALAIDAYPVYYWLRESRRKIAIYLAKQPIPAISLENAAEDGKDVLAGWLSQLFPRVQLNASELEQISAGIASRVQSSRNRRRKMIAAREAILVSLVLGAVFFACRFAGLLPEEIIHRYRTPTPWEKYTSPAFSTTPEAPFYYFYYVKEGDTLQSVAAKAGVKPEDILRLNWTMGIKQDESYLKPSIRLKLPARASWMQPLKPTPLTPASPPPPLTIDSNADAVLRRIQNSSAYWHSIWLTIQIAEYGPPGYLGPPLNQSLWQEWYIQPNHYAALGLDIENSQRFAGFLLENISFSTDPDSLEVYGEFITDQSQFTPLSSTGKTISPESRLLIRREETVADRQALVVDVYIHNASPIMRLWVDTITGVILRQLKFSQTHPNIVLWEKYITAIAYDQEFPPVIFNPEKSPLLRGFARDPTGNQFPAGQAPPRQPPWPENGHTPLPIQLKPCGLDIIRQPVFLQWPESWEASPSPYSPESGSPTPWTPRNSAVPAPLSTTPSPESLRGATPHPEARIAVFASHYYLGSLPLKQVSFQACRRSPNGRLIALSVTPVSLDDLPSQLYWFDLETPEEIHLISEYSNSTFSFSPNSRILAYVKPDQNISLIELETGDQRAIPTGNYVVEDIAWSPDQNYLALIAFSNPYRNQTQYMLVVLDARSGEIVYTGTYDPESGSVPVDSPTHEWELTIPALEQLDDIGCMEP